MVVQFDATGSGTVAYDGPAQQAWELAGKPQKNGQRRLSLTKLRR